MFLRNRNNLCYIWQLRLPLSCCHSLAALRQLSGRPAEPDQHSSVSQQLRNANPLADELLARQRHINNISNLNNNNDNQDTPAINNISNLNNNIENQETPDDWIDQYSAGLLPPISNKLSARSAVSAELASYHGKALEWFKCIDLFRALVHDTPNRPGRNWLS
jgi:hypothetical protein